VSAYYSGTEISIVPATSLSRLLVFIHISSFADELGSVLLNLSDVFS